MIDGSELIDKLGGRSASWDLLAELGASAPSAAVQMRCSRRTALKALKAASARIERRAVLTNIANDVAEIETRAKSALASSWPIAFSQLAERIEREGLSSVDSSERRRAVASLPRGIGVAR
jgi:hypothetical protein